MTHGNEPVTLVHDENGSCTHLGLTKREYFAAMAMQGMLTYHRTKSEADLARWAVDQADALIKALNETQQ